MRIDLTAGLVVPIGVLQQLRTNWPSDRKPVEGCGFRVFQHPSTPPLARDIAECRVIIRCPMDGRRASRTSVGLYELIFFVSVSTCLVDCFYCRSFHLAVSRPFTQSFINPSILLCADATGSPSFALFFHFALSRRLGVFTLLQCIV